MVAYVPVRSDVSNLNTASSMGLGFGRLGDKGGSVDMTAERMEKSMGMMIGKKEGGSWGNRESKNLR